MRPSLENGTHIEARDGDRDDDDDNDDDRQVAFDRVPSEEE